MAETQKSLIGRVLVTGAAGFIGMHTAQALLQAGAEVHGIDDLNPYYDPQLKRDRLAQLNQNPLFTFGELDIAEQEPIQNLFADHTFDTVIHLAAQAGVRYSLQHPEVYIQSNLVGFGNILEACRHGHVQHLVYSSSSSVYGRNTKTPFAEDDPVNLPTSLYAATKRANELMAESYYHLYSLPCTGLRFFTVYGPWGRPDMAYYKFTRMLYAGEALPIFNRGRHRRDMTYIDDIISGILAAANHEPEGHRIYNLGNNKPVELMELVRQLESLTRVKARIEHLPLQDGDVIETYADISAATADLGFHPTTELRDGLAKFIAWYNDYHRADAAAKQV